MHSAGGRASCHPDQKSNNCESSFESAVRETRQGLSAQTRTSYRYTSQTQEDKKGFHSLAGEENFLMLTILRVSLKYVACLLGVSVFVFFFLVSSFFVKLVFCCAAIDNYYLCFGAVPKVTKIFFFF